MQHYEPDNPGQASYGGYQGDQGSVHTYTETSSARFASGEKISPAPGQHSNQNLLRFAVAALSMLTLIALVVICLLFIGGVGGWISFLVAACVVLGVAITTTNGSRQAM